MKIEGGVVAASYISCWNDQVAGGSEPWRRSILLETEWIEFWTEFEMPVRCLGGMSRIDLSMKKLGFRNHQHREDS